MKITILAFFALLLHQYDAAAAPRTQISRERAHQLAATYFARYFGQGCGGVDTPVPRDVYWQAPVRIGYAGVLSGHIRVDRRDGAVSSAGHPRVSAESLDTWVASLERRLRKP